MSIEEFTLNKWPKLYPKISKYIRGKGRQSFDFLFVGDFVCRYMRTFAANLDAKEKYFLDDGISTLYLEDIVASESGLAKKIIHSGYCGLLGLKSEAKLSHVNAFSFFKRSSLLPRRWVEHEFEALKGNLYLSAIKNDRVLILGQALIEAGFVDESDYKEILLFLSLRYHESKVYYVPHRQEDPDRASTLCKHLNWEVKILEKPIELEIAQMDFLPGLVVSFFSTALYTIKLLYPNIGTSFFRIPHKQLKKRRDLIKFLYEKLSRDIQEISQEGLSG